MMQYCPIHGNKLIDNFCNKCNQYLYSITAYSYNSLYQSWQPLNLPENGKLLMFIDNKRVIK